MARIKNFGFFITLMVIFNISLVTCCSRDDEYSGGGGKGGRGKGGKGGKGGGGKGGSCFGETTMVWTKNETELDQYARKVMVKDLLEGSLVATFDINHNYDTDSSLVWTRATDVTILSGMWKAHSISFATGHQLTVTSPHLMIIWKDEAPYFVRADQVQIGDEMKVESKMTVVTQIEDHMIDTKVAVETEEGTIQVNGVLASGLCDDNPQLFEMMMKMKPMVKNYKSCHFGEEFEIKCMNNNAWMNAYLINNQMSI